MKSYKKKLRRILLILLFIYLALGIILYFIQDKIIFHPQPLPHDYSFHFNQAFKEINIRRGNGNMNIVQFLPKEKAKGIVLYFHGNMTNIERYASFSQVFTKNNYEVWMIDYPGYGKTTGKRTEQTMYEDATLFYDLAIKKTTSEKIIIYGKSLGTGVASYLASIKSCNHLVLETPYYSMTSMARNYAPLYPVSLIRYSFPVYQYLKAVKAPITIFHGTSDKVVPYKQSQKLRKEMPVIELITVPGGTHNNLYTFPAVIQKLDSILGL